MTKPQLVICVSGGIVQNVYASYPNIEITLVDFDADAADSDLPGIAAFEFRGQRQAAYIARLEPQPLELLAGSDTEHAIDAAEGISCCCH